MILAFPYRELADLRQRHAQALAEFEAAKHGAVGDKFDELYYEVAEKWLAIQERRLRAFLRSVG